MVGNIRWWLAASLVVLVATSSLAAPPFQLVPFTKKVDADPKKAYRLTKSHGPWMIMAMSFGGDDRMQQAQRLALELRRDHKLEAWIHEQEFDNDQPTTGLGVNPKGDPKKMRNLHGGSTAEVAVLVGSFKSADDAEAARTLEKVRTAKIKCLANGETVDKGGYAAARSAYLWISQRERVKNTGLLRRAFMTRNPLIPDEEMARETLDPFVVDLNRGIEHSLLENQAQYTVVVATFRGAAAYGEKNYEDTVSKSMKKNQEAAIDKAARDATLVVAQLRKMTYEAYVFHDRHESLVTIGSFNDLGTEMPDGHVELNPKIADVFKKFEAQKHDPRNLKSKSTPVGLPSNNLAMVPRTVDVVNDGKTQSIALDVSPRIILVPRQSIADVYRER